MAKREKIILLIASVALVYGLYALLFDSPKKESPGETENQIVDVKKLASDVTKGLNKGKLSKVEGYIMDRARAPWNRDPFLLRETADIGKVVEEVEEKVNFIYSGYVQLGSTRLAIINGREYKGGEALEAKGYMVREILPERVVIEHEQIEKDIIVPHQESTVTGQSPSRENR